MKKVRFLVFALALVVLILPGAAMAQEPGSGGPVIQGNFSGSTNIGSFNPIRCSGTDCSRLTGLMFPSVIGIDVDSGSFAPMGNGGIAADWTVSEDGLIYTVSLRDDVFWSDGTPITAGDIAFSYAAHASGEVQSPRTGYIDEPGVGIQSVNVIDDYTVEFVMGAPLCDALSRISPTFPLPAHVFGEGFEFADMVGHYFDVAPDVTYGPFTFGNAIAGEFIALVAADNFDDIVVPEGYLYVDVPDQTVLVERFLEGEMNFIDGPPQARRADIRASDAQVFDYAANAWDYVGLNLADPTNPQDGLDEDGNAIDQGNHPIFGDVRVRRAMQLGINVPDIVEGAVFGEGSQMAANTLPTSWALNPDLAPIPYDPEAAAALLEEAGWVDSDGDGVRECVGCMYAEEGTRLEFTLQTNQGNTRRETIGVIIQDQLGDIGFSVNFEAIDFNSLIAFFQSQEYDAYILGWQEAFPVNPDQTQFFTPVGDVVGSGFNAGSYNNERVNELMRLANDATATNGCDLASRAEYYYEMQQILQDDQPYLWLFAPNGMYGAGAGVENFDPRANVPVWNIQTWTISN